MADEEDRLMYVGIGPIAAIVLGVALVPIRELTHASNLSFVFLVLTIVVGHFGGRWAAVATALTSALTLDFFLTQPYMQLAIENKNDLIAFVGLAVCGMVAAALGSRRPLPASVQRQATALDDALRQLERGGPLPEPLQAILQRTVAAFPIVAAVVRDVQGRTIASCGSASLVERAPAVEGRPEDLASQEGNWPPPRHELPVAGLRVGLLAEGRTLGWVDLWGDGTAIGPEARRMLGAIVRVIAAMLAQAEVGGSAASQGPRPVAAWVPGRQRPQ